MKTTVWRQTVNEPEHVAVDSWFRRLCLCFFSPLLTALSETSMSCIKLWNEQLDACVWQGVKSSSPVQVVVQSDISFEIQLSQAFCVSSEQIILKRSRQTYRRTKYGLQIRIWHGCLRCENPGAYWKRNPSVFHLVQPVLPRRGPEETSPPPSKCCFQSRLQSTASRQGRGHVLLQLRQPRRHPKAVEVEKRKSGYGFIVEERGKHRHLSDRPEAGKTRAETPPAL